MPMPFFLHVLLAQVEVPPLGLPGLMILLMWGLAAALVGWYVAQRATDLRYATLADGRKEIRQLPISFRLLLPFCANVRAYDGPRHDKLRDDVQARLVSAGYDTVLSARDFLAIRLLLPFFLGPVMIVTVLLLFSRLPGGLGAAMRERLLLFAICILMYLALKPRLWLTRTIKARHRQIERGLPFILDLLTLSVEAGLDFMTSIRRLIERRKMDALSEEFLRAVREMQVGRTRKDALRDMARRVNQPDLSSVVSALVQADELGVGIGAILRIQADQMRTRRFQRAEKLANEAPVKLLFPLVCFIFPCVFLVLLGPIFLEMFRKGF